MTTELKKHNTSTLLKSRERQDRHGTKSWYKKYFFLLVMYTDCTRHAELNRFLPVPFYLDLSPPWIPDNRVCSSQISPPTVNTPIPNISKSSDSRRNTRSWTRSRTLDARDLEDGRWLLETLRTEGDYWWEGCCWRIQTQDCKRGEAREPRVRDALAVTITQPPELLLVCSGSPSATSSARWDGISSTPREAGLHSRAGMRGKGRIRAGYIPRGA